MVELHIKNERVFIKILAVCGSPRRGNTEWVLDRVLTEASQNGATTELLLLRELDIQMCDGCLSCEVGIRLKKWR